MVFRVRVPFPDIPDQPVAISPPAFGDALMAIEQTLKKVLQPTILWRGRRGLQDLQVNATNMVKQNSARLCVVLALDVPLEDFDHLRSEIHEPFTGWIFPGTYEPHAGHPGRGRIVTSPATASCARLMTRVDKGGHAVAPTQAKAASMPNAAA
jgi:hypothetical protein